MRETQSVEVCEDGYFNGNLGHVFIITAELLVLSLPMKQRRQLITVLNDSYAAINRRQNRNILARHTSSCNAAQQEKGARKLPHDVTLASTSHNTWVCISLWHLLLHCTPF